MSSVVALLTYVKVDRLLPASRLYIGAVQKA